jgi:hypothetical protein
MKSSFAKTPHLSNHNTGDNKNDRKRNKTTKTRRYEKISGESLIKALPYQPTSI